MLKRKIGSGLIVMLVTLNAVAQSPTKKTDREFNLPIPIELPSTPKWLAQHRFDQKQFTFVRIKFSSGGVIGRGRFGDRRWMTDHPEADLALAAQIERLTQLKIPTPIATVELKELDELTKYDFVYMAETGSMLLKDEEAKVLRDYLDQGGFLMMDDTWGAAEIANIKDQLKKVFPNKDLQRLTLEHPVFRNVFQIRSLPQSVSVHSFNHRSDAANAYPPEYFAIHSETEKGIPRIQILLCHNTDLADGWAEAWSSAKFQFEISRKHAFPMGINAVFYALTN